MGISRDVRFQTGFRANAFHQGTSGLNILIVKELPAIGSPLYSYAVPGVNEFMHGVQIIRLYIYKNNQWYALAGVNGLTGANGTAVQAECSGRQTYWSKVNAWSEAYDTLWALKNDPDATAEEIAAAEAALATAKDEWDAAKETYGALVTAANSEKTASTTALNNTFNNLN